LAQKNRESSLPGGRRAYSRKQPFWGRREVEKGKQRKSWVKTPSQASPSSISKEVSKWRQGKNDCIQRRKEFNRRPEPVVTRK